MWFCPFPRGRNFGIAVPSTYRENAPLCAMTIHAPLRRAPIVENAINALECEDDDGFCQVEIPSALAPSKTRVRRVHNDASCPKTQTNSRPAHHSDEVREHRAPWIAEGLPLARCAEYLAGGAADDSERLSGLKLRRF